MCDIGFGFVSITQEVQETSQNKVSHQDNVENTGRITKTKQKLKKIKS